MPRERAEPATLAETPPRERVTCPGAVVRWGEEAGDMVTSIAREPAMRREEEGEDRGGERVWVRGEGVGVDEGRVGMEGMKPVEDGLAIWWSEESTQLYCSSL